MSLTVRQPEGALFEKAPEGVYIARCYELIDIGTQDVLRNTPAGPRESEVSQVIIGWELFGDKTREDGSSFTIEKTYTKSLWKTSALFKDLVAWRGRPFTEEELKGFDLTTIVGAYCQIQVAHNESNGNIYANIGSIMALPKGNTKPKGTLDEIKFDIEEPDVKVFNELRDYYKMKIQAAAEFQAVKGMELVTATKGGQAKSDDVVITELIETEVNLDEVPF